MTIDRPNVFVAAHHLDRGAARPIVAALRDAGAEVFFDEDSIKPGSDWVARIEDALDAADKYVVLFTPNSQRSQNWAAEIGFAIGRGAPILPVIVGSVDFALLPSRLHRIQHVVWREGAEDEAIAQILRATVADAA